MHKKLTLSKKNATLANIFREIQGQSDYDFIYSNRLIKKAFNITITVKDAPLEKVLNTCFKNQPFTYSIENKIIVIKEFTQQLPKNISAANLVQDISGKITLMQVNHCLELPSVLKGGIIMVMQVIGSVILKI